MGVLRILDAGQWKDLAVSVPAPAVGARNVIRNGDMGIAQRGNGPFTGNVYGLDGWICSAGPAPSVTRVIPSPGSGSPVLRFVTSGQAAAGDWATATQYIEGVSTLQGQQVTYSFNAYAASGTPKIAVEVEQQFGTGGSPSAIARLSVGAVTISTTMARYSVSFIMPSTAGKILGTNGNDCCGLMFWLSAGANNAARASNIGLQNNTFSITDVQLEAGPVATPFERLPIAQQLAWCQRYFVRLGYSNANTGWNQNTNFGVGGMVSTTRSIVYRPFSVSMRAAPTSTVPTAASNFWISNLATGMAVTGIAELGTSASTEGLALDLSHGTMGVGGQAAALSAASSSGAYIDISAEL